MSKKPKKVFLMGDKIYLRPFERADLDGGYRQWINDPEVTRFLEVGSFPVTDGDLEAYFDRHADSKHSVLFAVVEKESDKHIGNARVYNINWVNRTASRGLMIGDKACWGKGYGLEVLKLMSKYAFEYLNLNKLKAGAISGNAAVSRINEKAGYKKEGELREEFFRDGAYHNFDFWGMTRGDYEEKKNKEK